MDNGNNEVSEGLVDAERSTPQALGNMNLEREGNISIVGGDVELRGVFSPADIFSLATHLAGWEQEARLPYSLPALIREAGSRFDINPHDTLDLAVSLHEKGLVSFPRTDSRVLRIDQRDEAIGALLSLMRIPELVPPPGRAFDYNPACFVDSLDSDHSAIIPTGSVPGDKGGLSRTELVIFECISRRFIGQFYPLDPGSP